MVVLDVPEIRLARNIFALLINDRQNPQLGLFMDQSSLILRDMSITTRRA